MFRPVSGRFGGRFRGCSKTWGPRGRFGLFGAVSKRPFRAVSKCLESLGAPGVESPGAPGFLRPISGRFETPVSGRFEVVENAGGPRGVLACFRAFRDACFWRFRSVRKRWGPRGLFGLFRAVSKRVVFGCFRPFWRGRKRRGPRGCFGRFRGVLKCPFSTVSKRPKMVGVPRVFRLISGPFGAGVFGGSGNTLFGRGPGVLLAPFGAFPKRPFWPLSDGRFHAFQRRLRRACSISRSRGLLEAPSRVWAGVRFERVSARLLGPLWGPFLRAR